MRRISLCALCLAAGSVLAIGVPTASAVAPTSCTAAPAMGMTVQHICSTSTSASPAVQNRFTGKSFTLDAGLIYTLTLNPAPTCTPTCNSFAVSACPTGLSTVTIDWGDGATSPASAQAPQASGALPVIQSHTYTAAGDFPVTVSNSNAACELSMADQQNAVISIGMTPIATSSHLFRNMPMRTSHVVSCGSLTVTANPISPQAGSPFSGEVGTFTPMQAVPDCGIPGTPYSATIDWGDGQTSAGTVTDDAGTLRVTGSHTYANAGSFPLTVTALGDDGKTGSNQATATVAAAPVTNPPPGGSGNPAAPAKGCKKKPKKKSAAAAKNCKKKKKK